MSEKFRRKILILFTICLFICVSFSHGLKIDNNSNFDNYWIERAILSPSQGQGRFGGVCSVSLDGEYAVIGTCGDNDNGDHSGSAYVFKRNGTAWSQEAKLLAYDGEMGDFFGCSVSIDGDHVVLGAPYDDDNGGSSGSAYVFKRNGSNWLQEAKLLASNGDTWDEFGCSVSIDGDYVIIGAKRYDDTHMDDDWNELFYGSAYVFKRNGTKWFQEAHLLAQDGEPEDYFGHSVSIDGEYAIIGAIDDDDCGFNSGSVYVFKRTGDTWFQETKLVAPEGEENDDFGYSICIDGNYAIIGDPYFNNNEYTSGSAYIFKRNGSKWLQEAKLLPFDRGSSKYFGTSVSIDGEYAVIGTLLDDGNGSNFGSAYVFKHNRSSWKLNDKLMVSGYKKGNSSVPEISIDEENILIGLCYYEGIEPPYYCLGSAYIFNYNHPPTKPTCKYFIDNDELVVSSTDVENDTIRYGISFENDVNIDSWTDYYNSGEKVRIDYEGRKGKVGVIAEDEYGAQSDWTIAKPKCRIFQNPIFQFIERIINYFPIFLEL